ncbi:hypothetical protein [Metapseudomonas furukawaii]|jgi:hypothetical protein|uniref:Uncharacterized protein n=1 Tax=Metapseudomonas furukawaii TaxID=1149133 RepID=A0AAD1C0A7_METFU|nr:hypothetical protein [Pseudomonas furukawaii]ELS28583.1 hypothetical protein ppKF707_1669 [Pseudomonas furukawaii]BAU75169.1 hypothetical protein KF707C_34810 [Pseudomonas furukawaii]
MSDFIPALAQLIEALRACAPAEGPPHVALERVMDALEILNDNPKAKAELRAAVAEAAQQGALHIDGVPLFFLRCLLMEEVRHD